MSISLKVGSYTGLGHVFSGEMIEMKKALLMLLCVVPAVSFGGWSGGSTDAQRGG